MSSRRFIFFSVALFLLGALPFLIVQPTAAASAGLSLGFSAPLEHLVLLVLLACIGLVASLLPRDGLVLIPVAFTLMVMVGGMLTLNVSLFPALRYFILGAVICLSLLVGIAREKLTVLMILVLASVGFHYGGFYLSALPEIANPIYYLIGVLLSLTMVLAIAVAFGVTLIGDHEIAWEKLKNSPRVSFIRGIFL